MDKFYLWLGNMNHPVMIALTPPLQQNNISLVIEEFTEPSPIMNHTTNENVLIKPIINKGMTFATELKYILNLETI
ncbi:hypothetical protein GCM10016272_14670 [Psychrobacter glaciei]|uniref:Uncharacterized protein n=1 Tax=Psychrobacter glaciei TaxID=619771 RepID=A0ABQ3GQK1_9GAMM|nr:hypothetical protein GCM10016272_14670 [Psychrobacter glaciei]